MDNIDIQEYFMKRRTVRRFSDRPLTDAELRRVLTAAAKAPTCGNMQLYSIILTRDPERKELLAKQHFCQPATKAPAMSLLIFRVMISILVFIVLFFLVSTFRLPPLSCLNHTVRGSDVSRGCG